MKNIEKEVASDEKVSKSSVVSFLRPFTYVTAVGGKMFYKHFKVGDSFSANEEEMTYLKDNRAYIKVDGL